MNTSPDTVVVSTNRAKLALANYEAYVVRARSEFVEAYARMIDQYEPIWLIRWFFQLTRMDKRHVFMIMHNVDPSYRHSDVVCAWEHDKISRLQYDALVGWFDDVHRQLTQLVGGTGALRVGYRTMEFILIFEMIYPNYQQRDSYTTGQLTSND